MPRYDVPNAAPSPLRMVQLFVNSVDHVHEREWLGTPEELMGWLEHNAGQKVARVSGAEVGRALELREALRSLLRRNNGGERDATAVATVNRATRAAGLGIEVDPENGVRLTPFSSGVDGALGNVLAVMLSAMLDGSWVRLKACPQCGWAFYDYSRNRSASWCSMKICGNRRKSREYRRRRAGGKSAGH